MINKAGPLIALPAPRRALVQLGIPLAVLGDVTWLSALAAIHHSKSSLRAPARSVVVVHTFNGLPQLKDNLRLVVPENWLSVSGLGSRSERQATGSVVR